MSLNFLGAHVYGGGPAHLFFNPAPRASVFVAIMNTAVAVGAFVASIYGNYVNASFGAEVPQYLFMVAVQSSYSALYFARLAAMRMGSDNEWSKILLTMGLLNLLQYGFIVWGAWLCYRMFSSKALVGTRMYHYFRMGKWMQNAILGISVLHSYCVVYTSYIALVQILVSLVAQRGKKKYVI